MNRIIITKVSKSFKIGFKRGESTLARIIGLFSGVENKRTLKVLDEVSLIVKTGEILGMIGSNGSGKSTLLRLIAGIYQPDSGSIMVDGKIVSLINLGFGLKSRLTMADNIYLISALFGVSKRNIEKRFNSIVEFSELEDFVDTKLYQFSSGMLQRLSFSIAIHADPDILILDEVFEVGDASFKEKSANKIKAMISSGVSAVLVSHDINIIKRNCHKVIWLDDGKIKAYGEPDEVVQKYMM